MTETITEISMLDMALHYANAWGWRVFPLHSIEKGNCTCGNAKCSSPGKHPRTKNGVLDATIDEAQIKRWWGELGNPEANIGIATGRESNLIVVDLDLDKGAKVNDLWDENNLPTIVFGTPEVQTGGGKHLYYSYPQNVEIKNSASRLGKFIDVRGDGGYVVAPPSKHISGKTYKFINQVEKLLEFPAEWIARLNQTAVKNPPEIQQSNGSGHHTPLIVPAPHSNLIVPDAINQGARNESLARIAGSLRRIGLNQNEIEAAISELNKRVCQPPLDAPEIHHIAYSVARYAPADDLSGVTDADSDQIDFENTLQPYSLDTFFDIEFPEKEILGFHIGKRDIAIVQAPTNAGKTTFLRNVGLCMAAGRAFEPVYPGGRPVKIAYFDFENDAQDVQRDLRIMIDALTPEELKNLKQNFIVIPKGLLKGELFQFNTHEKWANQLILENNVEFIFVDNISAAYDLNDENSNAEVNKKIIKPLLKMAYKGDCAFVFAHHFGKGKSELESAGVHAGRGASSLQGLSRTVINIFGDISKGEPVTIECAKRKTDGGQNYRKVFELKPDRWFHSNEFIVPPPKKKTAYGAIRELLETIIYPNSISTADIIKHFENEFEPNSLKKTLNELFKDGFLEKPKHGFYCSKDLSKSAAAQSGKVQNFYEKDDD